MYKLDRNIQLYEEKYMRFPEGRAKAITLSYDDGTVSDIKLLDVFKKYGLKGTFNLNSRCFSGEYRLWHGRMNEEETIKAFSGCGQEIALHGARHVFLDKVPLPEAMREICDNRAWLEQKFSCIVDGMAYAYGAYNDDIIALLKAAGVKYARTTKSTHGFAVPENWLKLDPTCHHTEAEFPALTDKFLALDPLSVSKHRESVLYYVWGHAFEFDENDNWDIIESFGKKAGGREDIWYATNGEVYNYVSAYKRLEFSIDGERVYNPSATPVWIEVRGRVYKIDGGKTLAFERGALG